MAKTSSGEMVELHFGHQLAIERLPFHADRLLLQRLGPPGALPVKPGGLINCSSFLVRAGAVDLRADRRCKAHVIEQAFLVVETQ